MQDRPTIPELLTAVTQFLDHELIPNLTGSRQFYGRVAANVLRMVMRELAQEESQHSAEWQRLDALLGPAPPPSVRAEFRSAIEKRTKELCQRIGQGEADSGPYREQVLAHLRATVREKLEVSNPKWIDRPREDV